MLKHPNLAKHIADAAFAEIFRELEYKAKWFGRTIPAEMVKNYRVGRPESHAYEKR
jgi:hypothetical protein